MLDLTEWLRLVGLEVGNPFANKQADDEREWLQACFVAHPAYNSLAYEKTLRSSILHAERGAGKTSACTMYEQLCLEEIHTRCALVVRFTDWVNLTGYLHVSPDQQVDGYLKVLFRQVANRLGRTPSYPWRHAPVDHALQAFLAWFCVTYGDELTEFELEVLATSGQLFTPNMLASAAANVRPRPPFVQLKWLLRALRAAGFHALIMLVDRVDEVAASVDDAAQGANLLLPLLGNLPLLELEGLVFKFFVPTEVIQVLSQRRQLRHDRLRCEPLSWANPQLLQQLLQNRMRHFSNGRIDSLAAIAESELRASIDEQLVQAARGSPRTLLLLGEELLFARANDASSSDLLLRREHLAQALAAPIAIPQLRSSVPAPSVASPALFGSELSAPAPLLPMLSPTFMPSDVYAAPTSMPPPANVPLEAAPDQRAIPQLQMRRDGSIYCGQTLIPGSGNLPRLQRAVLRYLFSKAGSVCSYSELGREIWHDEAIDEDTVRKVLTRLMTLLNAGATSEPYLERRSGGLYLLQHAMPLPLDHEPLWSTINLRKISR